MKPEKHTVRSAPHPLRCLQTNTCRAGLLKIIKELHKMEHGFLLMSNMNTWLLWTSKSLESYLSVFLQFSTHFSTFHLQWWTINVIVLCSVWNWVNESGKELISKYIQWWHFESKQQQCLAEQNNPPVLKNHETDGFCQSKLHFLVLLIIVHSFLHLELLSPYLCSMDGNLRLFNLLSHRCISWRASVFSLTHTHTI